MFKEGFSVLTYVF